MSGNLNDTKLIEIPCKVFSRNMSALVDCGAQVSCVNQHFIKNFEKETKHKFDTVPVRGISILPATGNRSRAITKQILITMRIGNLEVSHMFFSVPDLNIDIILGLDFLKVNRVILDFADEKLIMKGEKIKFLDVKETKRVILNIKFEEDIREELWEKQIKILKEVAREEDSHLVENLIGVFHKHRTIFSDQPTEIKSYECEIKVTDESAFRGKLYPIPFSKRKQAQNEINKWLEQGIIEPSNSSFSNPLVAISKADGNLRLCLDARQINKIILRDCTQPEPLSNILMRFHGVKYMSSFDLTSGYLQVKLKAESRKYVAFLFNGMNFQFRRLPFGLINSVSEFIKCLSQVLGPEILEYALIYVDDLLICSSSLEEHVYRLNKLFTRLQEYNVSLKLGKCRFLATETKYLGFIINREYIQPDPDKIATIVNFPRPHNLKELQRWLGCCNFYRRFCDKYSELTCKFKHNLSKNNKFSWTPEDEETFQEMKEKFLNTVVNHHPDFSKPFHLMCDASERCIGSVLFQKDENGQDLVVSFASKSLDNHQINYGITEKEALAVIFSVQKFRVYLIGNPVFIYTDHKSLTFLKGCKLSYGRVMRWILLLQEYQIQWVFVQGRENVVADALSRGNRDGSEGNKNEFKVLSLASSTEMKHLVTKIQSHLQDDVFFQRVKSRLENHENRVIEWYTIHKGFLFKKQVKGKNLWRLYVPESMIYETIKLYHERTGHRGVQTTHRYLKEFIFCKKFKAHIKRMVINCHVCQLVKANNTNNQGLCYTVVPKQVLHKVYVDLYGPLPKTKFGFEYVFILMDSFSKLVKFYLIKKATAKAVLGKIKSFVKDIGKPQILICDNAKQFRSQTWIQGIKQLDIQPGFITRYHAAANQSERYLKELNIILRTCLLNKKHVEWYKFISDAEHFLNYNIHSITKYKPIEVVLCKKYVDPMYRHVKFPLGHENWELESENVINFNILRQLKKESNNRLEKSKKGESKINYNVGDWILIKNIVLSSKSKKFCKKFAPKYKGTYQILECFDKNWFKVKQIDTGEVSTINRNLIKKYKKLS